MPRHPVGMLDNSPAFPTPGMCADFGSPVPLGTTEITKVAAWRFNALKALIRRKTFCICRTRTTMKSSRNSLL
jgi:hypothetical protein